MKLLLLAFCLCLVSAVPKPQFTIEANVDDEPVVEDGSFKNLNPLFPNSGFPFLRVGTVMRDRSPADEDSIVEIRRKPTLLEMFLNRPISEPVRPVVIPSIEVNEGDSNSSLAGMFTSLLDGLSPSIGNLPANYSNTTSNVEDVNGTKVVVNETITKVSNGNANSFFHFKVVQIMPEEDDDDVEVDDTEDEEKKTENDASEVKEDDSETKKEDSETKKEDSETKKDDSETKEKNSETKKDISDKEEENKSENKRSRRNAQYTSDSQPIRFPTSSGNQRFTYNKVTSSTNHPVHNNGNAINGHRRSYSTVYNNINGNTYSYSVNHTTENKNGKVTHTVHRSPVITSPFTGNHQPKYFGTRKPVVVNIPIVREVETVPNAEVDSELEFNNEAVLPHRATVTYHQSGANKRADIHPAPLVVDPNDKSTQPQHPNLFRFADDAVAEEDENENEQDVEYFYNPVLKPDDNEDDVETIGGIRPPDLSRDTRVNSIAVDRSNRGQGMVMVEPHAEVFDLSLVLKELDSHNK